MDKCVVCLREVDEDYAPGQLRTLHVRFDVESARR